MGDEYGVPSDVLMRSLHNFLFKLVMLRLFSIRGCQMLSVPVTSQLFVAVAGQKGTATCPTW